MNGEKRSADEVVDWNMFAAEWDEAHNDAVNDLILVIGLHEKRLGRTKGAWQEIVRAAVDAMKGS